MWQLSRHQRSKSFVLFFFLVVQCWLVVVDAQFGRKRRQQQKEEEEALQLAEGERLSQVVLLFGFELDKPTIIYFVTGIAGVIIMALFVIDGISSSDRKMKGNRPGQSDTVDVVIVGCGVPKRGMGWYHLTQLLEMKSANVVGVVEPFFLNPELCKEPPAIFTELVSDLTDLGVQCVKAIDELETFTKPTICLIAGRTVDNPGLFRACLKQKASTIYLEKPGAPTVEELQQMANESKDAGVQVYLGYNKNVTPYVQKTITLSKTVKNCHVFFCHNNSYSQADLPEVFLRNSEGLLKNMAVHELAVLVTFFGVTVDSIMTFTVNTSKLFSEKLSIWKPGTSLPKPEYLTDFSRAAFKITTKAGANVSVSADRCGGNVSFAVVKDEKGNEVKKFEFPDPKTAAMVEEKLAADPKMLPYLILQSDDYLELKTRVIKATLEGTEAEGVATIHVGIEALKLAEYATNELNKALTTTS